MRAIVLGLAATVAAVMLIGRLIGLAFVIPFLQHDRRREVRLGTEGEVEDAAGLVGQDEAEGEAAFEPRSRRPQVQPPIRDDRPDRAGRSGARAVRRHRQRAGAERARAPPGRS